jgi:hypothetical protein
MVRLVPCKPYKSAAMAGARLPPMHQETDTRSIIGTNADDLSKRIVWGRKLDIT